MKFSRNWIQEWLPLSWTVDELAERLTMAGVEVEGMEVQGKGLDQVVVAQILKSEPHPNADRLSVCQVESGGGLKQIVCGAKNYKAGDKVPLALPGARLPNGMEIKRSKLRGVESEGMMCSPKELGMAEDAQGLWILEANCKVGRPLAEALQLDDVILDLEITPNRPDLLSHWGLAREIAALANLTAPDARRLLSEEDEKRLSAASGPSPSVQARIADMAACPRYTARVIRGVQVGPSPEWLRRRLEGLGHRSISNVVDITNYVLAEIGQPLHAFDLHLLKGPEIVVRRAVHGEKLVRLDDLTSELRDDMLVIADAQGPVALAGVMGGKETGVSSATRDLLLESASFQPSGIRGTSKVLGVSTDSSYRFERGVDRELAAWASLRATALILQVCGGRVDGPLIDIGAERPLPGAIRCRYDRVRSLLGVDLPSEEAAGALRRLGCGIHAPAASSSSAFCDVEPPSYRSDLEREVDLIEEIARVHGIGKIPSRLRAAPLSSVQDSPPFSFAQKIRSGMAALGFHEIATYPLVSSAGLKETHPRVPVDDLILANPLTSEMDSLRPSLFHGLLAACARNLAVGNGSVALFELGSVFHSGGGHAVESPSLGMILSGQRKDLASWERGVHGVEFDFYDLKGTVDSLLESLGLEIAESSDAALEKAPVLEPGMGLVLWADRRIVGCVGKVRKIFTNRAKLSADAYYAELDAAWMRAARKTKPRHQPWAVYPSVRRDLAMTVALGERRNCIEESLHRLAKKFAAPRGIFLQEVDVFDIFQSDQMGVDKKSMAYSMIYQSPSRTLTDLEVNEVHQAIKKALKDEIACEIRE